MSLLEEEINDLKKKIFELTVKASIIKNICTDLEKKITYLEYQVEHGKNFYE